MKKYIFTIALIFSVASCQLVDVLDKSPDHQADLDKAITTPKAVERALVGLYYYLPGKASNVVFPTTSGSFKAGSMQRQDLVKAGNAIYYSERTLPVLGYSDDTEWTSDYNIIKNAVFLKSACEKIDASKFSGNRKQEILGEIAFLRAFANFRILIRYAEFWDENSPNGIVIRDEFPTVQNSPKKRSSVKESFDYIIDNLEVAMKDAPKYSKASLASKEAAQLLYAKVLFYRQSYAEALKVIENDLLPNLFLENNYGDVFSKANDSKEIIFTREFVGVDAQDTERRFTAFGNSPNKNQGYWGPTQAFLDLVDNDPRKDVIISAVDSLESRGSVGYNLKSVGKLLNSSNNMPVMFLRNAEVLLMQSECLYRTGASFNTAYAPIERLRNRAGASIEVPTNIEEMETAILQEWQIEAGFENWHEWFAMLRFSGLNEDKPNFERLLAMNKQLREAYEKEVEAGKGPEYLERIKFRRIEAIPIAEMNTNTEMEQNIGY